MVAPPATPLAPAGAHRWQRSGLVAGWLLVAATAHGQGLAPGGWFVQLGAGSETRALVTGLTWPWQREWRLGSGRIAGYWELALGTWASHAGTGDAWLTQIAITPVFRYRGDAGTSPWFLEGGIGLALLTPPYHSSEKRFSTRLNFGDHLAVGRSFGERGRQELSLRIEHYSNGGIRHPNPGENFVELRYAMHF